MVDDIQPGENGKPKELTKDQVEKVLKDLSPVIRIDENRVGICCLRCGSKAFIIIASKNQLVEQGIHLVGLRCCNPACMAFRPISERGNIDEKAKLYHDADGRSHHVLNCETGYLGATFQKNNGNKS